ncbi:MAG TPA: hypothetical protein VGS17_10500 [Candidatus Limnocylindria bacterium]|nr:hypothetical protein [Candidatus Limnocylindria bacterium]
MLPIGAVFAFIGRQLGRILSLAFSWATMALFGRVPEDRQLDLALMAAASLLWPVVIAGIAIPSIATFLLAFVTIPEWANAWVRPAMLVLAIVLPLAVGFLSTKLTNEQPTGGERVKEILRGFPYAIGLFIVLVWMMILAPLTNIRAMLRRWESDHVAIAVQPGGYDTVVRDLRDALARAKVTVSTRRAGWAYELPGRVLALCGGKRVAALIPEKLLVLYNDGVEVVIHPMDLAISGKKGPLSRARAAIARELTFTRAYQTWTKEAQEIEDALARAARGEADLDAIARRIADIELDFEQWEILYRLLLQVRLRRSPLDTDAIVPEEGPIPTIVHRLAGLLAAFRSLWPRRRQRASTRTG